MKSTLFKMILGFFALLSLQACNPSTASPTTKPIDSIAFTHTKIIQMQAVSNEIKGVDSTAFGVCDTCVTSYKAVILENRLLAEKVAEQNGELRALIDSNEVVIQDLKKVYAARRYKLKEVQYAKLE